LRTARHIPNRREATSAKLRRKAAEAQGKTAPDASASLKALAVADPVTEAAPKPPSAKKRAQSAAPVTRPWRVAQLESSSADMRAAQDAMNSRYTSMYKAFQFVDLDRSGKVSRDELRRALDLWGLELDAQKLKELMSACDVDGDGQIEYTEFVDALARDTVAPAAMGKRDMQALEAMGVEAIATNEYDYRCVEDPRKKHVFD